MIPSLEIARAHIRTLEVEAERARTRTSFRSRRRVRDFIRRAH
ncbi:MAG TPA: hypothetical protein VMW94_04770 [Actinomycetes bacterium]|jgi:hypothetical protein|nr:hypothetical protein [Actinomycetes bacterium]